MKSKLQSKASPTGSLLLRHCSRILELYWEPICRWAHRAEKPYSSIWHCLSLLYCRWQDFTLLASFSRISYVPDRQRKLVWMGSPHRSQPRCLRSSSRNTLNSYALRSRLPRLLHTPNTSWMLLSFWVKPRSILIPPCRLADQSPSPPRPRTCCLPH